MSDHANYLILSAIVITWCFVHSAMISISVTDYLKRSLGAQFRFYRLFFNVVSALTLVPVVMFAHSVQTQPIFSWDGYLRIIQVVILGTSGLLFYLGARHYDAGQFLGLKQIREGTSNKALTESGELNTSGILGVIRHPWYVGAALLIWAGQLDISAILVNTILTAYLFIGTLLEEKKLVREFGAQYSGYQARVSMYIPYKWLKSKIIKAGEPDNEK